MAQVRSAGYMGLGVFATKRFRRGQFVVEYAGDRFSNESLAQERKAELETHRLDQFFMTVMIQDKRTEKVFW